MYYIGDPEHHAQDWQLQDMPDNCAVAAQTSIINDFLPNHLSLQDANYVAQANGWYHPGQGGTSPDDMGKLFDVYGVPYHQENHATIAELTSELQQGHGVIVGVNSSELWDQGPLGEFWHWVIKAFGLDTAQFNPADHAVVVTGINVSDPSHPTVVLNDSGEPNGAAHEYPLDRFMDAWGKSDFNYVATNVAPPNAAVPHVDLGAVLGIGTTALLSHQGVDLPIAAAAGSLVSDICHQTNWDDILTSI
jgi:hypothetical protein